MFSTEQDIVDSLIYDVPFPPHEAGASTVLGSVMG